MTHVVAFVPDLLFGSNVLGGLRAAGHDPLLVADPVEIARTLTPQTVLVVDLTADARERIAAVAPLLDGPSAPASLAFFSHVEADVRDAAQAAGFDLVVPRSRMARAMGELVDQLAEGGERGPGRRSSGVPQPGRPSAAPGGAPEGGRSRGEPDGRR